MAIIDVKLIPNYIYFYHLDQFCVLPMYPETVADSMSSSFRETNALSRSAPVFSYVNSGPRTISISLDLHRDMMNDINRNVSNLKDNVVPFDVKGDAKPTDYIDTLIKYLQSISLPKYRSYEGGTKSVIPPMVAVRFGDAIFIKGIVNGPVSVTYKKPIMDDNKYALCSISFGVTETDPYDAESVVKSGSFRGISATFKDGIFKSTSKYSIPDTSRYNVTPTPPKMPQYYVADSIDRKKVATEVKKLVVDTITDFNDMITASIKTLANFGKNKVITTGENPSNTSTSKENGKTEYVTVIRDGKEVRKAIKYDSYPTNKVFGVPTTTDRRTLLPAGQNATITHQDGSTETVPVNTERPLGGTVGSDW